MGGTVRVLTIRGIPVNVHVSWLVMYGLITWTLAVGYFPHALPDLPAAAYWANGATRRMSRPPIPTPAWPARATATKPSWPTRAMC